MEPKISYVKIIFLKISGVKTFMNAIYLSSAVSISISDPGKDPIAKYFSISISIRTVSGPGPELQVECSLCIRAGLCS